MRSRDHYRRRLIEELLRFRQQGSEPLVAMVSNVSFELLSAPPDDDQGRLWANVFIVPPLLDEGPCLVAIGYGMCVRLTRNVMFPGISNPKENEIRIVRWRERDGRILCTAEDPSPPPRKPQ